jgi:hypothetical protein
VIGLYLVLGGLAWACYSVVLRRHVRDLSVMQITASTITSACCRWLRVRWHCCPEGCNCRRSRRGPLLVVGVVGSGWPVWWNSAVMRSVPGVLPPSQSGASDDHPYGVVLGQSISAAQLIGAGLVAQPA